MALGKPPWLKVLPRMHLKLVELNDSDDSGNGGCGCGEIGIASGTFQYH